MGLFDDMFNSASEAFILNDLMRFAVMGKNAYVINILDNYPDIIDKKDKVTGLNTLLVTAFKGPVGTMELLLDRGASITEKEEKNGYNVLHLAIMSGVREKTSALLERDDIASIINEPDSRGITALMDAAAYGEETDIVESLLQKGADPSITDKQGRTALSIARASDCARTVELLEQWGEQAKPAIVRTKPKPGHYHI